MAKFPTFSRVSNLSNIRKLQYTVTENLVFFLMLHNLYAITFSSISKLKITTTVIGTGQTITSMNLSTQIIESNCYFH